MPSAPAWPSLTWFLLAISLAISALGFRRVVYFVSLGYGFSIAALALLSLGWFFPHLDPLGGAHLVGLALYGLRLGLYLAARERQPSYQRELEDVQARGAGMGIGKKVAIWVGVALLYVVMFTPGLYVAWDLSQGPVSALARLPGVGLLFLGLGLEAWADRQKSAYKAKNPARFCDVGLYRVVRCPNYLGEVVFWVGSWLAGLPTYTDPFRWAVSLLGLVCIVLIMMGSTKRLEFKQDERYGSDPDYQRYIRTVPVLFPLVPLYSLKKVRVYLE